MNIDEFLVKLSLDTKDWEKKQQEIQHLSDQTRDDVRTRAIEWETLGKRANEWLSSLTSKAAGLASIFLGGLGVEKAITHFAAIDSQVGRTAENLGIATTRLKAWQTVVKELGGTSEEVDQTFRTLQDHLYRFAHGQEQELAAQARRFGVNPFRIGPGGRPIPLTSDEFIQQLIASPLWQRADIRERTSFASELGLSGGMFEAMKLGPQELEKRLEIAQKITNLTKDQADNARTMQKAWVDMEEAAIRIGRVMTNMASGAITDSLGVWQDVFTKGSNFLENPNWESFKEFMGSGINKETMHPDWLGRLLGIEGGGSSAISTVESRLKSGKLVGAPTGLQTQTEIEAYIRQSAVERGIDPNVAVAVAKSEGLYGYTGDFGTSFGPFQLHYASSIPGYRSSGLGDTFTQQTGLNARDPSTIKQQIDFALDQAARGGWGPWHGWRGAQWAGINRGGNTSTATTHIGTINVNPPPGTSPQMYGRSIKQGIEDAGLALFSNYSPN